MTPRDPRVRGARMQRHLAPKPLLVSRVDRRCNRSPSVSICCRARRHDFCRLDAVPAQHHQPSSERIAVPQPTRQRLVHDHDGRPALAIVPRKVATAGEGDPDSFEPARRQRIGDNAQTARFTAAALEPDVELLAPRQRQRYHQRHAGGLNDLRCPHPVLKLDEDPLAACLISVALGIHMRQSAGGSDRIHVADATQAARTTRSTRQHAADGDLSDDQRPPHPLTSRRSAFIRGEETGSAPAARLAGTGRTQ